MVRVIARICTPVAGDDLRRVAEDFAIEIKKSPIGDTVSAMSVHSWPDDNSPGTRLKQENFDSYTHDGVGDEGAVLGSWEDVT